MRYYQLTVELSASAALYPDKQQEEQEIPDGGIKESGMDHDAVHFYGPGKVRGPAVSLLCSAQGQVREPPDPAISAGSASSALPVSPP